MKMLIGLNPIMSEFNPI